MNRLITAHVADTSACPKRQAVFYLREAMSHARSRTNARRELAPSDGMDIGERRASS